jgi:hypothetical protein
MLDLLIPIFILISIVIIVWSSISYLTTRGIEEPYYEVIKKYADFEIREFSPYIIAYTDIKNTFSGSSTSGFRVLANYIFGGNKSSQKIKMTAPVIQEPSKTVSEKIEMTPPVIQEKSGDFYRIAFMMPSKYSMSSLPEPLDPRVQIMEIGKEIRAVYTFRGWAAEKKVKTKMEVFRTQLEKHNLNHERILLAQYDPPYTPPYMRKNELQAILINYSLES